MMAAPPVPGAGSSTPGFTLGLGGLVVAVRSGSPDLAPAATGTARKFQLTPKESTRPDCRITACWGTDTPLPDLPLRFDSGAVWKLYDRGEDLEFRLAAPRHGSRPFAVARLDRDGCRGEVLLRRSAFPPDEPVHPLQSPLDELLLLRLLARRGGVELHGCAVRLTCGAGLLFVGASGQGKSTLARLWTRESGATVLADDRVVVRRRGEELRVYGTPWQSDAGTAEPGSARLDGLFFLHHGPGNTLRLLPVTEAVARLFAASFPPFYDPEGLQLTLDSLQDLAETVPALDFHFVPDHSAIAAVRAWHGAA